MNEFRIIDQFFKQKIKRKEIRVGIGDDAAVIDCKKQTSIVVSSDTLIEGVHFPKNVAPFDIGYKSLAVNVSDMAAMAAVPAWFTLALTLANYNETWISEFAKGLFHVADLCQIDLIGGDTTRGTENVITITIGGYVDAKHALLRSKAKVGDLIYVTGTLGDAGFGLHIQQQKTSHHLTDSQKLYFIERLNRPALRWQFAQEIKKIAHAAIDVSDGLAQDLEHILLQSHVGATIHTNKLPISSFLQNLVLPQEAANLALTSGDDYELCFTIAPKHQKTLEKIAQQLNCRCTCIGSITKNFGLKILNSDHSLFTVSKKGYQHF